MVRENSAPPSNKPMQKIKLAIKYFFIQLLVVSSGGPNCN